MPSTENNTPINTPRLLAFDIDSQGDVIEHPLTDYEQKSIDNSLLASFFPDCKVAIVTVPLGYLEPFQELKVRTALTAFEFRGVVYKLAGGGSSTKDGKFYLVDADHWELLARRFHYWAEAAIVYLGILLSPLKKVASVPDATVLIVPDGLFGTNDCRGWLRKRLFDQLDLPPDRMYQFRVGFERSGNDPVDDRIPKQAKGCFKVLDDETADFLGADLILPVSSVKPEIFIPPDLAKMFSKEGRRFKGPILFGIREVSEERVFRSSYQLTQHANAEVFEHEIKPGTLEEVQLLKTALETKNHYQLLKLLGVKEPEELTSDDELRAVEAVLLADREGQVFRFPYINNQLNKVLARWAFKMTTGGGLTIPGFTLTDDGFLMLHEGKLYSGSDWIPQDKAIVASESKRSLCVRYPIRGIHDLLPVEHMDASEVVNRLTDMLSAEGCQHAHELAEQVAAQQVFLVGTFILHSKTAKKNGGDFDFDYVCSVGDKRFPRFVRQRFELGDIPEHQEKTKVKAKSPWRSLPLVAMAARGNQIGKITDAITSCTAAGRFDLALDLIRELQNALDSLKWSVRPDMTRVDAIVKQVARAPWLAYKRTQEVTKLPPSLDVEKTDHIGRLYNEIRQQIPDLLQHKAPIADFKVLVSGAEVEQQMYEECKHVNSVYAAVVGRTSERQDELNREYERLSAELEEVRHYSNRQLTRQKYEAKSAAFKAKQLGEERTKREFQRYNDWLALWAKSKKENRKGWLQAMLTVVCSGKGSGAILFHTFLQELVDGLADETGGVATHVSERNLEGKAIREDDGRTFLLETDEDGAINSSMLFKIAKNGDVLLGTLD